MVQQFLRKSAENRRNLMQIKLPFKLFLMCNLKFDIKICCACMVSCDSPKGVAVMPRSMISISIWKVVPPDGDIRDIIAEKDKFCS